jgi:hypothetical protein
MDLELDPNFTRATKPPSPDRERATAWSASIAQCEGALCWILPMILIVGCRTAGMVTLPAPAIVETAIYREVTGYRCWATCAHGTECNPKTDSCEPIPCGGECEPGLRCDTLLNRPRCVVDDAQLRIWRESKP